MVCSAAGAGSGRARLREPLPRISRQRTLRFGYCTEFIINLEREYKDKDAEEEACKDYLASIGDSLVVVSDDALVKVHVHTNHPGLAFEKALTYGSLSRMKVDNMREEHRERVIMDCGAAWPEEQAGGTLSPPQRQPDRSRRQFPRRAAE